MIHRNEFECIRVYIVIVIRFYIVFLGSRKDQGIGPHYQNWIRSRIFFVIGNLLLEISIDIIKRYFKIVALLSYGRQTCDKYHLESK